MILGVLFVAMAIGVTIGFIVAWRRTPKPRPITETDVETFALEMEFCDDIPAAAREGR